jgi:predicted Zn-dependent protease
VNGLPAVQGTFRIATDDGDLAGQVMFVRHRDLTFRFMGYTPSSRMGTYAVTFERALESFAPMNEERWINLQPRRIDIVRAENEMTVERFFQRYPSTVRGCGADPALARVAHFRFRSRRMRRESKRFRQRRRPEGGRVRPANQGGNVA